jgi:hypothetical protein
MMISIPLKYAVSQRDRPKRGRALSHHGPFLSCSAHSGLLTCGDAVDRSDPSRRLPSCTSSDSSAKKLV